MAVDNNQSCTGFPVRACDADIFCDGDDCAAAHLRAFFPRSARPHRPSVSRYGRDDCGRRIGDYSGRDRWSSGRGIVYPNHSIADDHRDVRRARPVGNNYSRSVRATRRNQLFPFRSAAGERRFRVLAGNDPWNARLLRFRRYFNRSRGSPRAARISSQGDYAHGVRDHDLLGDQRVGLHAGGAISRRRGLHRERPYRGDATCAEILGRRQPRDHSDRLYRDHRGLY